MTPIGVVRRQRVKWGDTKYGHLEGFLFHFQERKNMRNTAIIYTALSRCVSVPPTYHSRSGHHSELL